MDKFKIKFDKDECIGCGACASVCDNWSMEKDKAKLKKTTLSEKELKNNKEAEDVCPVKAIKIGG